MTTCSNTIQEVFTPNLSSLKVSMRSRLNFAPVWTATCTEDKVGRNINLTVILHGLFELWTCAI